MGKHNYVVLVVEDNEDVRHVVATYLRSKGFEVDEAADGAVGWERAAVRRYDIILLDVLLPKVDGIETLKKLREEGANRDTPVVLMSAVLQVRDLRKETESLGVAAFLQKPFQMRGMLQTLLDALAGKSGAESTGTTATRPQQKSLSARPRITVRTSLVQGGDAPKTERATVSVVARVPLPEEGDLEQVSVPELLHRIFWENRTGWVRLLRGTDERRIYFQNGYPVYAESSLVDETLGAHLVRSGVLNAEQHAVVKREMAQRGRQYGETLLTLGFLSPHELYRHMEVHLRAKVVAACSWFSGRYRFYEDEQWKDRVIVVQIPPGRAILDGIETHWDTERITATGVLSPHSTPFVMTDVPYRDEDYHLNTFEARVLQLVAQGHTVGEIVNTSSDRNLALKVLYAFYVTGAIGFSARKRPVAPDAAAVSMGGGRMGARPTSQESAVLDVYLRYRTADYYTLLGVDVHASPADVYRAYENRVRQFGLDNIGRISEGGTRDKAKELLLLLQNAVRTLADPEQRAAYDARYLRAAAKHSAPPGRHSVHRAVQQRVGQEEAGAEQDALNKGVQALREGNPSGALTWLLEAERKQPAAQVTAYRWWAQVLCHPDDASLREEALRELTALAERYPTVSLIPYVQGAICSHAGLLEDACRYFEAVLAVDPDHLEASRQLRVLRAHLAQRG